MWKEEVDVLEDGLLFEQQHCSGAGVEPHCLRPSDQMKRVGNVDQKEKKQPLEKWRCPLEGTFSFTPPFADLLSCLSSWTCLREFCGECTGIPTTQDVSHRERLKAFTVFERKKDVAKLLNVQVYGAHGSGTPHQRQIKTQFEGRGLLQKTMRQAQDNFGDSQLNVFDDRALLSPPARPSQADLRPSRDNPTSLRPRQSTRVALRNHHVAD